MFLPVQLLNVTTPGIDLCFFPSKPTIETGWALVWYAKLSNILECIIVWLWRKMPTPIAGASEPISVKLLMIRGLAILILILI